MKKIVGIFTNEENAVRAIENLKTQGYEDDEISIVTKDEERFNAIQDRTGVDVDNENDDMGGTMAGAAAGGTIGGIGGLLLGLGALAIPGVGPIVAAGPIASTIVGALAGGAVGGIAGALVDYGVSEDDAKEYEERVNQGDIMVLVDDPDDDERRENVYENFRQNDSYNKNSYTHGDALIGNPTYDGGIGTTPRKPMTDVGDDLVDDERNTYDNTTDPTLNTRNTRDNDPLNTRNNDPLNTRDNDPLDDDPLNPTDNKRKY